MNFEALQEICNYTTLVREDWHQHHQTGWKLLGRIIVLALAITLFLGAWVLVCIFGIVHQGLHAFYRKLIRGLLGRKRRR